MKDKAESIAECPQIEQLWHIQTTGQNISVTSSQIMLSHSDVGPYIHVFCPEDHHVVGPTMITCLKGGMWDDVTMPYCSASPYFGIPVSDLVLIGAIAGSAAIIIFTLTVVLTYLLCFRRRRQGLASRDPLGRSSESIPSTSASFKIHHQVSPPSGATRNGLPFSAEPGQRAGHYSTHLHDPHDFMPYRTTELYDETGDVTDRTSSYYADSYHVVDCPSSPPPPPPPPLMYESHTGYATAHAQRRATSSIEDGAMFTNHGFLEDRARNYAANWDNEYNSTTLQSLSSSATAAAHDVTIQPLYRNPGTTVF